MENRVALDTETDIPLSGLRPAADKKIERRQSKQAEIPISYLCECLEYRDGKVFYKTRPASHFSSDHRRNNWNARFAGKEAGYIRKCGKDGGLRWTISIDAPGRYGSVRLSRSLVVWAICKGKYPSLLLDHRDRDTLNDRVDNLRLCTNSQNRVNTRTNRNNLSGLRGVSAYRRKWKAVIQVEGKGIYLGLFKTKEEAHAAYLEAARLHFGEFAPEVQ